MEKVVLKGANLLDLIYDIRWRSSLDLDFSMEGEFDRDRLEDIGAEIEGCLKASFKKAGYDVFDVELEEKPKTVTADMAQFWGGYRIAFKVGNAADLTRLAHDRESRRMYALALGKKNSKRFTIDISKFEYCQPRRSYDLEGTRIYIYSPEMLAFEKLRAICQQLPEYSDEVNNPSRKARAKDFLDIYAIATELPVDLSSPHNAELLRNIFEVKHVPLAFLGLIPSSREYHRGAFASVRDTVSPTIDLQSYDFYFDYVCGLCDDLKPLWIE